MTIIKDKLFEKQLFNILYNIAKDKKTAAKKFERELNTMIKNIVIFPYKFRASYYFDDEDYRDLIYRGYTIIYKVDKEKILILEIFKWQER